MVNQNNKTNSTKMKSKSRKKKDIPKDVVYITAKYNKKDKEFENTLEDWQKNFWKHEIFNEKNIRDVSRASTSKGLENKSERDRIIYSIVNDKIGSQVIVKQYNSEEVYNFDQIHKYVRIKFNTFVANLKKKNLNKSSNSSSNKKRYKVKIDDDSQDLSYTEKILRHIPTYNQLHFRDDAKNMDANNKKWNEYSMMHTLYEPWNFVIYNGSHQIKDNGCCHFKSRLVLKFPKQKPMFVLWHGNLVHAGASSKFGEDRYSMTYSPDVRAFAYIHKLGEKMDNTSVSQSTKSEFSSVSNVDTHQNQITTQSFNVCEQFMESNGKCLVCDHYVNPLINDNGFEIDMHKVHDEYMEKAKTGNNFKEPIFGDLKNYGWAVYSGIDCHSLSDVGSLFDDLRVLINRNNTITRLGSNKWTNAQANPPPEKGSGRMKLVIKKNLLSHPEINESPYLESVIILYQAIQTHLKYIEGFHHANITEAALLYNKGALCEQKPHKDYEKIPSRP